LTQRDQARWLAPGTESVGDADWENARLLVARDDIALLCALFEAHDNEFLVRTETRGLGYIRIWFPRHARPQFDAIMTELAGEIPLQLLGFFPGMEGLEEIYPDEATHQG
jgi:hypothetical protein